MKIERQLAVWALLLLVGGVIHADAFAGVNTNKADAFHPVIKQFAPDARQHSQHHASAKLQKSHSTKLAKAHSVPAGKVVAHSKHSSKAQKLAGVNTESIHATVAAKAKSATKLANAKAEHKITALRTVVAESKATNSIGKTFVFQTPQKFASSLSVAASLKAARLAKPELSSREMHAAIRANYAYVALASEQDAAVKINSAIAGKKNDAVQEAATAKLASAASTTANASAPVAAKNLIPAAAVQIASAEPAVKPSMLNSPAKISKPIETGAVVIPPTIVVAANLAREVAPANSDDINSLQRIVDAPDGKDMVAINDQPPINDAVKVVTGDLSKDEFYVFGVNERVPDEIITRPNAQIAVLGGTEEEAASKIAAFKIAMKKALETKMIAEKAAAVKVIVAVQSTEKALSDVKKTVRSKFLDSRPQQTKTVLDNALPTNALTVPNTIGDVKVAKEAGEHNAQPEAVSNNSATPVALTPVAAPDLSQSQSASKEKLVTEDKIIVPEVKLVKIKQIKIAPSMELASLNKKTRV